MGLFSRKTTKSLNWIEITSINELNQALADSKDKFGLFFKHSTRCSISRMVLSRFESHWEESENCNLYYIDLLAYRDVSNALAEISSVEHKSPQVIVIKDRTVIYNDSHGGISAQEIRKLI